jgi:hypothetical protein
VAEDGGISLGELAEQRSISKDAARRLVNAGKVPAHQTASTHGPEWCCHPDGAFPKRNGSDGLAPGLHDGGATPAQPQDVAALVERSNARNEELAAENAELVKTVAAWQSQAVVLAGRLTDARGRLALAALSHSPAGGPGDAPTRRADADSPRWPAFGS